MIDEVISLRLWSVIIYLYFRELKWGEEKSIEWRRGEFTLRERLPSRIRFSPSQSRIICNGWTFIVEIGKKVEEKVSHLTKKLENKQKRYKKKNQKVSWKRFSFKRKFDYKINHLWKRKNILWNKNRKNIAELKYTCEKISRDYSMRFWIISMHFFAPLAIIQIRLNLSTLKCWLLFSSLLWNKRRKDLRG